MRCILLDQAKENDEGIVININSNEKSSKVPRLNATIAIINATSPSSSPTHSHSHHHRHHSSKPSPSFPHKAHPHSSSQNSPYSSTLTVFLGKPHARRRSGAMCSGRGWASLRRLRLGLCGGAGGFGGWGCCGRRCELI